MKTADMSLRQYLSTQHFAPKQAEALEKLFTLSYRWRWAANLKTELPESKAQQAGWTQAADELDSILGPSDPKL